MAAEFLREKVNTLRQNVMNEKLQVFQHEMIVAAADKSTGDPAVDDAMKVQAQNARIVIMASQRRLAVYEPKLSDLEAELNAPATP